MKSVALLGAGITAIAINLNVLGAVLLIGALVVMTMEGDVE